MGRHPTTRRDYYASLAAHQPLPCEDSAESIVSSQTTDSDVDSDAPKAIRKQHQRKKWKVCYSFEKQRGEIAMDEDVQLATKRHRRVVILRGFLSKEDRAAVHYAATHKSVKDIKDRSKNLKYVHEVQRFEVQMRMLSPSLYKRLMMAMQQADMRYFGKKSKKALRAFPEVEYITYDTGIPAGSDLTPDRIGSIESHIDNAAIVTLVGLLSDPAEFTGGVNRFAPASKRHGGPPREVKLEQGDVVLFRGEKLLHSITPVTSGKRQILQIEFSRY